MPLDDQTRAFLAENHWTVLVTHRRDGRLQTSPVVSAPDDQGRICISVTATRAKTRNLRRDPRATVCVLSDGFFGPWVQVDGTAEIVELPDAMSGLEDLYRKVQGEHPDWEEFRQAMRAEQRCLVRITPS